MHVHAVVHGAKEEIKIFIFLQKRDSNPGSRPLEALALPLSSAQRVRWFGGMNPDFALPLSSAQRVRWFGGINPDFAFCGYL